MVKIQYPNVESIDLSRISFRGDPSLTKTIFSTEEKSELLRIAVYSYTISDYFRPLVSFGRFNLDQSNRVIYYFDFLDIE